MKFSLNWLMQVVDHLVSLSLDNNLINQYKLLSNNFKLRSELVDKILDRLNLVGLEIESITALSKIPNECNKDHLIIGEVISCEKVPNSNKLSLCMVKISQDHSLIAQSNQNHEHLTTKASQNNDSLNDACSTNQAQIICGASNVTSGIKVICALPGAILPNNFAIQTRKLAGVKSYGMICSSDELGFNQVIIDECDALCYGEKNNNGIMILPDDAPVGMPIIDYFDLQDKIVELKITPNRGDCLSIIGIAREIVANLYGILAINYPMDANFNYLKQPIPIKQQDNTLNHLEIAVDINHVAKNYTSSIEQVTEHDHLTYLSSYYTTTINATDINNLSNKINTFNNISDADKIAINIKTRFNYLNNSLQITRKLIRSSIGSISPIVDILNYLMILFGQPMHAFDANLVGNKIIIRKSRLEDVLLIDNSLVTLDDSTLVIANSKDEVIAIAGVMGSKHSSISPQTLHLVLESANFNSLAIAGKAKKYKLKSDAAYRFERHVDATIAKPTIDIAAQLINYMVAGQFHEADTINCASCLYENTLITELICTQLSNKANFSIRSINYDAIKKIIGSNASCIDRQIVNGILHAFGAHIVDDYHVLLPPYLANSILINENFAFLVARIITYDNIEAVAPVASIEQINFKNYQINQGLEYNNINQNVRGSLTRAIYLAGQKSWQYINHDLIHSCRLYMQNHGFNEIVSYAFLNEQNHHLFNTIDYDQLNQDYQTEHDNLLDQSNQHKYNCQSNQNNQSKGAQLWNNQLQGSPSNYNHQTEYSSCDNTILNPIANLKYMRKNLFSGLFDGLIYNFSHGHKMIKLFEIANTFVNWHAKNICNTTDNHTSSIKQANKLAGLIYGDKSNGNWTNSNPEKKYFDFYDLKSNIIDILENTLKIQEHFSLSFTKDNLDKITLGKQDNIDKVGHNNQINQQVFHPSQSALINYTTAYNQEITIGIIGAVHPQIIKTYNLKNNVYLFEINLTTINAIYDYYKYNQHKNNHTNCKQDDNAKYIQNNQYTSNSAFYGNKMPKVTRDLSFFVYSQIDFATIAHKLLSEQIEYLIDFKPFDIYSPSEKEVAQYVFSGINHEIINNKNSQQDMQNNCSKEHIQDNYTRNYTQNNYNKGKMGEWNRIGIRFMFQANKTLEDAEINASVNHIINALTSINNIVFYDPAISLKTL